MVGPWYSNLRNYLSLVHRALFPKRSQKAHENLLSHEGRETRAGDRARRSQTDPSKRSLNVSRDKRVLASFIRFNQPSSRGLGSSQESSRHGGQADKNRNPIPLCRVGAFLLSGESFTAEVQGRERKGRYQPKTHSSQIPRTTGTQSWNRFRLMTSSTLTVMARKNKIRALAECLVSGRNFERV